MSKLPATPAEVLARMRSHRRPRPELETTLISARDSIEQKLVDVWCDVLGLEEVGIQDNFFALGGDSLHMTQIASRVFGYFSVELGFDDLFDCPTIAGISDLLRGRWIEDTGEPSTGFNRGSAKVQVDESAKSLPSLAEEGDPLKITSVVVPTRGRPAALKRCLTALFENLTLHGHTPRILVADGTPEGDVANANREAVREALIGFQFDVLMIGSRLRRELVNRLIAAGFSETVRFALTGLDELGEGCGANRNMLSLLTAGEAVSSLDDDTECRFARSADSRPMLQIETGRRRFGDEPAELWVYPSRASILSSVPLFGIDVLGCHLEILGRRVADLAALAQSDARLSIQDPNRVGGEGRVLVSLHGIVGDCGWGSPSPYLFLGDSSFERLTASDQAYTSGSTSREMLRVPSSLVVSEQATNFMSTAFAADNRSLLPPWVPIGRGADVVFGITLKQMDMNAWFGHVPWAILHKPIEKRRFWPGEVLRSAATTDIRGMFCNVLSCIPEHCSASPGENLQRMGQTFLDVGDLSPSDFSGFLTERSMHSVDMQVSILEDRLQRINGSKMQCRSDIGEYIQRLKQSRSQMTSAIPAELLYGRDVERALHLARKLVSLYGELLCNWSDLVGVSRNLVEGLLPAYT